MKNRGEAGFEVNHSIATQIFGLLISNALECFLGLHDCDGVSEALQVFSQAALVGAAKEPLGKRFRNGGWQIGVVCVARQLDDGLGAQHPIQMLVQEHFGKTRQQSLSKCQWNEVSTFQFLPASSDAEKRCKIIHHEPKTLR